MLPLRLMKRRPPIHLKRSRARLAMSPLNLSSACSTAPLAWFAADVQRGAGACQRSAGLSVVHAAAPPGMAWA